jgi:arginine exporter protein ArgO
MIQGTNYILTIALLLGFAFFVLLAWILKRDYRREQEKEEREHHTVNQQLHMVSDEEQQLLHDSPKPHMDTLPS